MKMLIDFYKKYRTVILIGLVVFIILEVFNLYLQSVIKNPTSDSIAILPNAGDINAQRANELPIDREWIVWLPFIAFTTIATLLYLIKRFDWVDRIFVGMVLLRAGSVGDRRSGVVRWKIRLSNLKGSPLEIEDIYMTFGTITHSKTYRITGSDLISKYPITVPSKGRFHLVLELNKFYMRFPELAKMYLIRSEVVTSQGKRYRSIWSVLYVRIK